MRSITRDARPIILATGAAFATILFTLTPRPAQAEREVVTTIDGDDVYRLLPPDRIPAIRDPEFVTGNDADRQMLAQEPVLGLVIDGDVRAYSLWQLDAHEIVNDVVGGVPVAVTW